MNLSDLEQANSLALSKIASFRSFGLPENNKYFNSHFHKYKNQYNYFGFVEVEIDRCEPFLMFSCNDDLIAMSYFWYGANSYEPKSISEWISRSQESEVILDIGSFTGLYSLAAVSSRKNHQNLKIYAFEPTKRVYARLLMNIQVNRMRKIIEPINLAVSNCEDTVRFLQYRADNILGNGASFIEKNIEVTSDDELVKTISVDEFVDREKIKPQLIKIDVEQAEVLALEGMSQTLSDCSPTIFIEVAPQTIERSVSILSKHGYKLYTIDEYNKTLVDIADATKNKVQNILAEKQ